MTTAPTFRPPRRRGTILHIILIILFAATSVWSLGNATARTLSPTFIGYIVGFVLFALPLPLFVYRLYSLLRGSYTITPEYVHISWGLRSESVPLPDIRWARPITEVTPRPRHPLLAYPGAWVGLRNISKTQTIEYMATQPEQLLILATDRKQYAISPENPSDFLHSFRRANEQGILTPVRAQSLYPGALLGNVWQDGAARLMILLGLALSFGMLVWVSLIIAPPAGNTYNLRTGDQLIRTITSAQLIALPVVNSIIYILDLGIGLFFYRRPETHPLAYLLWATSVITSVLMIIAIALLPA